jgi:hypothetical protein
MLANPEGTYLKFAPHRSLQDETLQRWVLIGLGKLGPVVKTNFARGIPEINIKQALKCGLRSTPKETMRSTGNC